MSAMTQSSGNRRQAHICRTGGSAIGHFAKQPVAQIPDQLIGQQPVAQLFRCHRANRQGSRSNIGLLRCKSKDRLIAEYAHVGAPLAAPDRHVPTRGIKGAASSAPTGASGDRIRALPEALRDQLPSIERLEQELGLDDVADAGRARV